MHITTMKGMINIKMPSRNLFL